METLELSSLNALRKLPHVGNRTLETLLEYFGSAEAAWEAADGALSSMPKLSEAARHALLRRFSLVHREAAWEALLAEGIELIPKSSPRFPKLLSEIPDAPPLLYVRGNFDFTKPQAMLAVVGARKHSAYGTRVTERLVFDLAKRGAVIVSGLAFGIDRLAHEVTLTAEGQTLSVLPGGLDDAGIAPRTHLALAHAITEHGALISEWAPGTEITPAHFPVRNRLIAGLCLGTLIIEAEEASGSLITASLATDYNRDVFAIPGPIFSSTSDGPNRLLQRGAKAILMAEDIFSEYAAFFEKVAGEKQAASNAEAFLTTEEERLVNCLGSEPMHIDTIIKISGLETGQVQSLLTLLELKGVAKNIGSMHYTRQ